MIQVKELSSITLPFLFLSALLLFGLVVAIPQVSGSAITPESNGPKDRYLVTGSGFAFRRTANGTEKLPSSFEVELKVEKIENETVTLAQIWDRLPAAIQNRIIEIAKRISNVTGVPYEEVLARIMQRTITIAHIDLKVKSGTLTVGESEYDVVSGDATMVPFFRAFRLSLQVESDEGEGTLTIQGIRGRLAAGTFTFGDATYRVVYRLTVQEA